MREVQATVTRPDPIARSYGFAGDPVEQQVGIQVIAGVVTFQLEDGTLIEMDARALELVYNTEAGRWGEVRD